MCHVQSKSVQRETAVVELAHMLPHRRGIVERVSNKWHACKRTVKPDLMRSPSFSPCYNETRVLASLTAVLGCSSCCRGRLMSGAGRSRNSSRNSARRLRVVAVAAVDVVAAR